MTEQAEEQQAQAPGSDQAQAYVYGIVPADVEVDPDARGVGDPPAKVRLVRCGEIGALISDIDARQPLGRPEDLMAHEQLLDAAARGTPILPLQFGAVQTDAHAVEEELLAPHHDDFAAALAELDGRIQFVVKGRYAEEAVLREVLAENSEAAQLREEIAAAGDPDATRNERIRLGEIINTAVSARREADTRRLGDVVGPLVVASSVRPPSHELDAVNVAVLVGVDSQQELQDALDELAAGDWAGRVELRLVGPMAPYDFVVTQQDGG